MAIRVFLVDDEPLALSRLSRMLASTGRVAIAGSGTDPLEAAAQIRDLQPDVVFLDIEMPGLSGFEMLSRLDPQPLVVFTTAYDRYALEAFTVHSIDYLLKPVEQRQLERALAKIERIHAGSEPRGDIQSLLAEIAAAARGARAEYPERVASRLGEKVEFIELARVTHFFANERLTYAATASKSYVVDQTIQELEQRLDPKKFVRIHRAAILNLDHLHELHTWFAGRMVARLKDEKKTELTVARDRVKALKDRLGI